MNKENLIKQYNQEEEKIFVAQILDKITQAKTKNQIKYTDFLDMQKIRISKEILAVTRQDSYKFYKIMEELEKSILIIYPKRYENIFESNRYNYGDIIKAIRIILPNELKGEYAYKDYLSCIMKMGIKREKIGDIIVFENGADILVKKEISQYILENINKYTRFSKSRIEEIELNEIRKPNIKKENIIIVVSSLRLDNVVSEIIKKSRTITNEIISENKVLVNYVNETTNHKMIKEADVIIIRGKGKFIVKELKGKNKKNKIILILEHYI